VPTQIAAMMTHSVLTLVALRGGLTVFDPTSYATPHSGPHPPFSPPRAIQDLLGYLELKMAHFLAMKKLRISPPLRYGRILCTPGMLAAPADAGSVAAGATGGASRGDTAAVATGVTAGARGDIAAVATGAGAVEARPRAGFLLGKPGNKAGGCFLFGVSFTSTFAVSEHVG
jgi:hypothetical protein